MLNAIVLVLIALGANVNAEDTMAEILVDRASNNVVGEIIVDMDDATLAKPAKAKGGAKTVAKAKTVAPRKGGGPIKGTVSSRPGKFTPIASTAQKPKRLFGGTNKLMAGNGKPIQERAALPSYWGGKVEDKGIGYGWTVGSRQINQVDKKAAPARAASRGPSGTFTPFAGAKAAPPKRVFGGTNKLMAGNGKPIQESAATPSYWGGKKSEKGLGYGWFQKNKALPEVSNVPFKAQSPPAPGFGGARPPTLIGNRPLAPTR